MRILQLATLCIAIALAPAHTYSADDTECVIVLHGLGRTRDSMDLIEAALNDNGYCVWNRTYPSRHADIEWLAANAIGEGLAFCEAQQSVRIHFVTHSLGGILVRQYLQDSAVENLGRIVMLSPPNQGSDLAELLKDNYLYQVFTGPVGKQLGTDQNSLPRQLLPIPGEIGILTGNSSSDPWFSPSIPGEDDGKVSIENARLDEMQDFMVVSNGHTFIMRDGAVIKQILHFLAQGKFNRRD